MVWILKLERDKVLSTQQCSIKASGSKQYTNTVLDYSRSVLRTLMLRCMTDVQNLILSYKSRCLMKILKFTVQKKWILNNFDKGAIKYQSSERVNFKRYERMVSLILYQNHKLQEKSSESQLTWSKRSILHYILILQKEANVIQIVLVTIFRA